MLSLKKITGFAKLTDHCLAARARLLAYAAREGVSERLRKAVGNSNNRWKALLIFWGLPRPAMDA